MKVFVIGATGAIGPHAVHSLVAAGHEMAALVRSEEKAGQVARLGARPVFASLFDRAALAAEFAGYDAVVNLATAIPSTLMYPVVSAWKDNTRIRTEGVVNVVDAALAAGVPRIVQESIALAYVDRGDQWIDEDVPLDLFPIVESTPVAEASIARFTESGGTGVVLRFGLFYGPGSSQSAEMLAMASSHLRVVYGAPGGYFSPIQLEDAGEAVAAALAAAAGVYNIVDDEPVTKRGYGDAISAAVNRTPWVGGPGRLAGLPGKNMSAVMRSLRVSNQRFKDATGWEPRYPNAEVGWAATAKQWRPDRRGPISRVISALLGLLMIGTGIWATFAPHSWYLDFPGFGRHWPITEPPYNAHLVTDLGGFYLALAVTALVGAAIGKRAFLAAVGLMAAIEALPHFAFHLIHHEHLQSLDAILTGVTLALQAILGFSLFAMNLRTAPTKQWVEPTMRT